MLAAVAPTRVAERDTSGKTRAVTERLGVRRGARYVKGEKRLFAFDQAMAQREVFDANVWPG